MEAWLSGLAQITHEPAVVAIPVKLKEEGFTCKRKRKRMVRQQAIDLTGNETLGVTHTESGVEDVATSQARPTSDVVATPNLVQWNALHLGRLVQEMIGAKEVCYRYKNELSWLSGQVAPRPDGSGSGDSSRSSQSVRAACICNMNSLLAYGYLREHLEHSPMVAMETHRPATRAYELLHDWYKARAFVHGGFVTSSQDHYQAGHPKVIHVDDSVGTQQCEGCGVGSIACARFQKRFKSRGNNKRRKRCLECVAQQKSPCGQSDDEFIVRNMPNKMVEELRRRCIASDGCMTVAEYVVVLTWVLNGCMLVDKCCKLCEGADRERMWTLLLQTLSTPNKIVVYAARHMLYAELLQAELVHAIICWENGVENGVEWTLHT
jgi:hypothetical protein